jgi:hypothetical protein
MRSWDLGGNSLSIGFVDVPWLVVRRWYLESQRCSYPFPKPPGRYLQ